MRKINVSKKTGFKVIDPTTAIIIRDNRGILFYSTEPYLPHVTEFNLPPGPYFVDSGNFEPMQNPVQFKLPRLPIPERIARAPYDFDIVFEDNPNKCSIFWKEKLIVFDRSFDDKPLPQLFFIYFHELGHSKYGYDTFYTEKQSEAFADLYATKRMLEYGFNPSQIGESPTLSLSDRQDYRKNFIIDTILNNNSK